jgi:hypothetical protein
MNGPTEGTAAVGSSVGSGWAVAFDRQDRLHITTIGGEVWRITENGVWEKVWAAKGVTVLFGLAFDVQGRVLVSELLSGKCTASRWTARRRRWRLARNAE